jgi:multiple sugar transport system ATP-binding protein
MATVSVRDVWKSFGSTEVLHGVSIEIEDTEFVTLVGPSGCGKTTLLRMLAGLENITSGEIAIGGRVVNNIPPKQRDIAMVFQNYALYPHMTVRANMAFSLELAKAPKSLIDQKVRRAAEILGLTQFLNRYPRQLSGGQRQRVAMGRAIVRDPRSFCSTNRSPTWMPSFVWPCGGRSRNSINAFKPQRFTSPTTRSRP